MPDVILMDVRMPGIGGLEATRRIKEEMPHVRIVILTVSESEEDLFAAVKGGAQGYLLKNIDPDDLIACLQQVQRGEAPLAPPMAAKILHEFASRHAATGPDADGPRAAGARARGSGRRQQRDRAAPPDR